MPCTFAITVPVDVTTLLPALRAAGRRVYATQLWLLATVVNRHEAFRMTTTAGGDPAVWEVTHPAYTVLNPDRGTFACIRTPWVPDFAAYHDAVVEDLARHRSATTMFPQGAPGPDSFDVSSLPWTSFTGFQLDIRDGHGHLAPIFTLGRFSEQGGTSVLPVALQVHHAAADGYHTGRFFEDLQGLCDDPAWVD